MSAKKRPEIVVPMTPLFDNYEEEMRQSLEAMLLHATVSGVTCFKPMNRRMSAVHSSRNALIADLIESRVPFTHILMMDADMTAEPDTIVRLLDHKVDIVAGLCTNRAKPIVPNARMRDEKREQWEELWTWPEGLIDLEGGGVGTGLMLISLNALQQVAEVYFQCMYERDVYDMPEARALEIQAERLRTFDRYPNAMWFRWLAPRSGAGENGEDMSFCWVAQRYAGLKVHVDTSVQPKHIGKYKYCIDDFVERRDEVTERARLEGRIVKRDKPHLSPIDLAPPTPQHKDLEELIACQ